MRSAIFIRAVLASLSFVSVTVDAHTWVEQLSVIAPNGTMTGTPGFPRGNVLRSAPGFGDGLMVNLIPPNGGAVNVIDSGQLMCRSSQTTQSQTNGSPKLSAAPGALVALRYQENGHVTLPQNQPGKPANRGTNFVYYTTQSQATDKFLDIHREWTVNGTGGNGRGRLISTQNFDDGQCYQINGSPISTQRVAQFKHTSNNLMGADLWCQQDVQIPADAKAGSTITLYWVWDWPTMPGTAGQEAGKQEIYTTCMDIDIVAGTGAANKAAAPGFVTQDFVSAAAVAQFANIADPTAVASPQMIPFSSSSGSGASTAAVSAPVATTVATTAATTAATLASASTTTAVLSTPAVLSTLATGLTSKLATSASSSPVASQSQVQSQGQGRGSGRPNFSTGAGSTLTVYKTNLVTMTSVEPIATIQATQQVVSIVTQTEVDRVTMTHYHTVNTKRGIPTDASELAPELTMPSASACSKLHAVYKLKARSPFYVLPHQESSDVSC